MSRIESFSRMFSPEKAHGEVITRVEIPLIQRDYAQGRRGEKVDEIRRNFLSVLRGAVSGGDARPVSLDFVYGERLPDGALQPLDGQQRLTTLFLLHWFLASRSGNLSDTAEWTNFTYETRPSARRFCQRLVASTPDADAGRLSDWVTDQSWYLFMWRYDPTINSMLVMLDAIQDEFGDVDAQEAWERLVDPNDPAISFHLLPLPDMGSAEDLYVKMNSRGKPLTEFENFKARFEKVIEWSPAHAADFALMADTDWSDILWNFRGDDDLVDDEFLRYFDFVTEVCEWSDHELASDGGTFTRLQRATRVFGKGNQLRADHLAFLFTAFNVWKDRDVTATFVGLFDVSSADAHQRRLPLFFRDPNINLFEAACRSYGEMGGGGNRIFTFGQTLLLYAVVIHLAGDTNEFRERLRALRNLVEGSQFEMRAERLPRLLADTRELIENGALPEPGNSFAVAQISDETEKRPFLAEHPELAEALWDMEDHVLLKGSTTAFALDPQVLESRWATFEELMSAPSLWWDVTGALLTIGEYQWPRQRNGTLTDSESFQFGTWDPEYSDAWREVLVGRTRADAKSRATVFGLFLDAVSGSSDPVGVTLQMMQDEWLQQREAAAEFDWRYYTVKYRAMRAGASGLYYAHGRRMGFSLTNLPGGKKYRNANFYDPYLLAVYRAAGEPDELQAPRFSGYEWDPRWLRLTASSVGIRCVPAGYELLAPTAEEHTDAFKAAAVDLDAVEIDGDEPRLLVRVPKAAGDENGPDAQDRIQVGVRLVRRLIMSGL
jgi:hypothetical protein